MVSKPDVGIARRVADVSAGTYTSFASTTDGHMFAWGLNNYGQLGLPTGTPAVLSPTLVPSLRHATVAAGQHHTLAVMKVNSRHFCDPDMTLTSLF